MEVLKMPLPYMPTEEEEMQGSPEAQKIQQ